MPRHRPTSGYARLAQADEDEPLGDEESDEESDKESEEEEDEEGEDYLE